MGAPYTRTGDVKCSAFVVTAPPDGAAGLSSVASGALYGEAYACRAGSSVGAMGDLNADGLGDLIVGDWSTSSNSGAVYVVLSPVSGATALASADTRVTNTSTTYLYLGGGVAGAGDTDGDGFPDLLAAAVTSPATGVVYLWPGGGW